MTLTQAILKRRCNSWALQRRAIHDIIVMVVVVICLQFFARSCRRAVRVNFNERVFFVPQRVCHHRHHRISRDANLTISGIIGQIARTCLRLLRCSRVDFDLVLLEMVPLADRVGPDYRPKTEKPAATVSTQVSYDNVHILPQTPQLIALLT